MSIPSSYIVNITPRVISAGAAGITINGLFLTENRQMTAGSVKEFLTSAAVAEYFGYDSAEYNTAVIYFAGYTNSFKKPASIKFASRVNTDLGAYLRGGKFSGTLEALKAITDGSMKISINGNALDLKELDFNAVTSLTEAALKVQSAINTAEPAMSATVTYSALNNAFQINSGVSGAASAIGYASPSESGTDLSGILGFTESAGAVISAGMNALTPAENMAAIAGIDSNFVTFTTLYDAESDESVGLGKWANAQGVNYCYIPWSNEAAALMPDNVSDISSVMQAAGVTNFAPVYNGSDVAAGIMGAFASVDWTRLNGAIDVSFKQVEGLTPTVTNEQDAAALDKKYYTYMGNFATKNSRFDFLYKGLIVGTYVNISAYINAVWLNETIKNAILVNLGRTGKLAYNETSYTILRAWFADPITQALNNGVIQTGVELSEAQKAQLMSEVGEDVSGDIFSDGYYLYIADPGASVRATGDSPNIALYYTDGGVIKKLEIGSTVIF